MKRIHRLILAGACSLALGIGLAACGGSSNDSSTNSASPGSERQLGYSGAAARPRRPAALRRATPASGSSGGGYGY